MLRIIHCSLVQIITMLMGRVGWGKSVFLAQKCVQTSSVQLAAHKTFA